MNLGEQLDAAQQWDAGAEPVLTPPANALGARECFEQGERFPLPMALAEYIDGVDTRCFQLLDVREIAWLELSAIDRCTLQKFYAHLIDLVYADDQARAFALIEALIGPGFQMRFYRARSPLPGLLTIVTPAWSVAVIDGTRNFQDLAMQGFGSLGGPAPAGAYSTMQFWIDAAVYVHHQLVLDGMVTGTKATLVGHSYGGAVATLVAARYHRWTPEREIHLLTFGTPKTGDQRLHDLMIPVHAIHICNDIDLVTLLPPNLESTFPLLALTGLALARAWNGWRAPPHRVRMNAEGRFLAIQENIDDFNVLELAVTEAIGGLPFASITGHLIGTYIDRLERRCPGQAWPTKPPIGQLEKVPVGKLALVGAFPQAPAAAKGTLRLQGLVEKLPPGRGLALGDPGRSAGGLVLTSPAIVPASSLGAIALASLIPVECPYCTVRAGAYSLTFAGITNGTCTDCASLNQTWTLIYSGFCTWTANIPGSPCWCDNPGGGWRLVKSAVDWSLNPGFVSSGHYLYGLAAPIGLCNHPLALLKDSLSGYSTRCNWPMVAHLIPLP